MKSKNMKKNNDTKTNKKQVLNVDNQKNEKQKNNRRNKKSKINNASPYTSISRYDTLDILNGRKPRGYEQRKQILFLTASSIIMNSDDDENVTEKRTNVINASEDSDDEIEN